MTDTSIIYETSMMDFAKFCLLDSVITPKPERPPPESFTPEKEGCCHIGVPQGAFIGPGREHLRFAFLVELRLRYEALDISDFGACVHFRCETLWPDPLGLRYHLPQTIVE